MFVITGAGDGLEKAQIDYINTELNRNDIVVATNMPGAHAEPNAVNFIAENGMTPVAGGVSRNSCAPDGCEEFLNQVGAEMIGPVTSGTRAKIPGQSMYAWNNYEAWEYFLLANGYLG